ncbi:hypothetical protein RTCIAT899_PA00095 (plasmid) [Rhizobium tropici CIAT 899]|nr:hypothetical protein RTCIAT899_PA00095 [Rhizobium tropici CIAT 899]
MVLVCPSPVRDSTVKVYHYDDLQSLKAHVLAFVTVYNFCDAWTKAPSIFKINPHHLIPGPNF